MAKQVIIVNVSTGQQAADVINQNFTEVYNKNDSQDALITTNTAKISYTDAVKVSGIEDGAEVNPTASEIKSLYESNANTNVFTDTQVSKLSGIDAGADVNNISDVNATDLTDGGASTLHYHVADRARANHTGTQLAATISDFQTTVSANTDVAANTAKVGITTQQAADIVTNNAKVSYTDVAVVSELQSQGTVIEVTASRILALTDANRFLNSTSATDIIITVPPQTDVAWNAVTQIDLSNEGAGAITIAAGIGVTIQAKDAKLKTNGQYVGITLKRVALNKWRLFGDLTT